VGRHWTEDRLPGDTGLPEPGAGAPPAPLAPAAPPPAPAPEFTAEAYAPAAIDALIPPEPPAQVAAVEIEAVVNGHRMAGAGETFDEAIAQLRAVWEAAQNATLTLQWEDGSALDGMDKRLMLEAVEMYADFHAGSVPASIQGALARLRRALGEE
jgi:hypothetical protein